MFSKRKGFFFCVNDAFIFLWKTVKPTTRNKTKNWRQWKRLYNSMWKKKYKWMNEWMNNRNNELARIILMIQKLNMTHAHTQREYWRNYKFFFHFVLLFPQELIILIEHILSHTHTHSSNWNKKKKWGKNLLY